MSETLISQWYERYRDSPHQVVIREPHRSRELTADELFERSELFARHLAARGCTRESRVAIEVADPMDFLVAHLAALRLGAISVPIPAGSTVGELIDLVADCTPAVAVTDRVDVGPWHDAKVPVTAVEASRLRDDSVCLDGAKPDDIALMLYTSGTTGKPKGVPLSHRNLLATALAVVSAWEWTKEDSLLLTLPLYHMHGLGVGIHGTLCAGASVVAHPKFNARATIDQISTGDVTMFFGVPTMYAKLLASEGFEKFGGLRLMVSGSAPLSEEAFRRISQATGCEPLERYGMSETGMIASNPLRGRRLAGSVGTALPGVELRLSKGDRGEILVRGDAVFGGYWQRDEATLEAFDGDGWFHSGDLGSLTPEGYLVINGRAKELIIKGGQNIFPRELEACLEEIQGVVEAAVIGEPDEYWGEKIVAVLVSDAGELDGDVVRQFIAGRLNRTKVPDEVRYVDALPRNRMGKIQRELLKGIDRTTS